MSFYIRNIEKEEDMQKVLQTDKLVVVRFGQATNRYTQWLDKMFAELYGVGQISIDFAACEVMDMSAEFLSQYSVTKAHKCALVFFYRNICIPITFNGQTVNVITEQIYEYSDLLSLLVFVQRSTLHGHKVPDLSFFFNSLSMKQSSTSSLYSSEDTDKSECSWND